MVYLLSLRLNRCRKSNSLHIPTWHCVNSWSRRVMFRVQPGYHLFNLTFWFFIVVLSWWLKMSSEDSTGQFEPQYLLMAIFTHHTEGLDKRLLKTAWDATLYIPAVTYPWTLIPVFCWRCVTYICHTYIKELTAIMPEFLSLIVKYKWVEINVYEIY